MDADLFRAQIEELHGDSFVWALRCCRQDRDLAQEALQIVYLKILERKAIFKGKSTFKTWLFSVIRHTIFEMKRRSRNRIKWKEGYMQEMANGAALSPSVDYRIYKFRQKIAKLPLRQQQVLDLHFYHNMTLQEIADVLGIGVGSVRQHFGRGKRKLKLLLSTRSKISND